MKKLAALWLAVLMFPAPLAAQDDVAFERSSLRIETSQGVREFDIEIAADDRQRSLGLMFRRELAPDAGMLFVYPSERIVNMWMANTYVPLDMLFIESGGRIARIAENTIPLSRATVSSRGRVRAVLELNAGTARRLGIRVGDRVLHERLR